MCTLFREKKLKLKNINPAASLYLWRREAKSDQMFRPHTGLTCSICQISWDLKSVKLKYAKPLCFKAQCIIFVYCSTPCLRSLTSALDCCITFSNDFRALSEVLFLRMQHNRCIHQPGGHLFCRPHETCCPSYNVGVMTERNTAPSFLISYEPYLCAALTAGEKQSSKTTGSLWHQHEPNCPTRHAPPLPRAVDSVRRGWDATWSSIMNPGGLCFLLQQVQRQFILAVNHRSIYRQHD